MTAAEWNAEHHVGEEFIYDAPLNLPCLVATRSRAWDLADGTTVVLLTGRIGGYDVGFLEAVPPILHSEDP